MAILDSVPGVIYQAIARVNQPPTLTFVSDRIIELLGMTAAEMIALPQGCLDFIHPADRAQFDAILNLSTATCQPFRHCYRVLTASGTQKWVQDSARLSYNAEGEVLISGIWLDISSDVPPLATASHSPDSYVSTSPDAPLPPSDLAEPSQQAIAHFIAGVIQQIHQTLLVNDILDIVVNELRGFFRANRVTFYRLLNPQKLVQVAIATTAPQDDRIRQTIYYDWILQQTQSFCQGNIRVVNDVEHDTLPHLVMQNLLQQQTKAMVILPVMMAPNAWGLLIIHTPTPRRWHPIELDWLQQLSEQVSIALQQSELYQQLHRTNSELERKFQARTAELQLAFEFEATLKRITDKVRDSLDEDQILQSAVQELVESIGVSGCNAALYDLDRGTSTICYEYTTTVSPSQGRVAHIKAFPEIYDQLFAGMAFQFCSVLPSPVRGHVSMLACPIQHDQGILGDLWLINHKFYAFSEQDIRLTQQVANQCAIALRQARLYKAAQTQVTELERLNHLKDDFLSTVSHELRTPIASIKMATQMLELMLNAAKPLPTEHTPGHNPERNPEHTNIHRYLQILQSECDREITLINDLLDLSRLEAKADVLTLTSMTLQDWLSELVEPFVHRADKQQQQLQIHMPPGLSPITTDFSKLDRALSELLNNACKYTPAKEKITLSAKIVKPGERAISHLLRAVGALHHHSGAVLIITIANSGVEISPSEQTRIFEKFYRIPNADPWKHGGTGLGLALVKKLIEELEGLITVESDRHQTTFTVGIPLHSHDL
ncbi:MAG TPA: GAF domain-containing protein [Chroococcidiopsis sp.]